MSQYFIYKHGGFYHTRDPSFRIVLTYFFYKEYSLSENMASMHKIETMQLLSVNDVVILAKHALKTLMLN